MPLTAEELAQWTMVNIAPGTWVEVILNFLVALLNAFIISFIYRQCRGMHATRSFIQTLYMLCLIIASVVMVITSVRGATGIAVAFGLIGALSVIRFRTIVKDNRDTAFVFLALGSGLAAGTGMWWIGLCGLAVIGITLLLMENAPWRRGRDRIVLKLTMRPGDHGEAPELTTTMRQFGTQLEMMNVRTLQYGELLEVTYALTLLTGVDGSFVARELLRVPGIENVNIFNIEDLDEL